MPDAVENQQDQLNLEIILPKMTDKQQEYLRFIVNFFQMNHYYPSRREIAAHMSVSVQAVNQNITLLQKKGYLTVATGGRRNIRLTANAVQRLTLDAEKNDIHEDKSTE
ncbi:MAG: HTH domain-containing protein [Desulfovibrio sp.]|jgi:SOS-response transcriptional repressor LexA|nr:HTH domain-containing protein [Desulfovibrio sp.]